MVTVPDTVKALSAGLACPRARVFLVARTLRENDSSLLRRDPVGRNQTTQVQPSDILNLMIGVAAADPVTDAPTLVRAYRAARYSTPLKEIFGDAVPSTPILGTGLLGPALDYLIDVLARPSALAQEVRRKFAGNFRVTLIVGEALMASVEDTATGRICRYDAKGRHTSGGGQTFRLHGKERKVVPLRRVASLEFAHFELAAELWADSLKHGANYEPSLLDPSDDGPENETAAQGPGKDQNAAAVSDQTADTELDGSSQLRPISEREKSQALRVVQPGRHLHRPRTMTYEQSNSYSAFQALA